MDNKLYLLSEESKQVDYPTKVKYLFESDFNRRLSNYLDLNGKKYLYISIKYGILEPDIVMEPYDLGKRKLTRDKVWCMCTGQLIYRYMNEHNLGGLIAYYAGNNYNKLENYLSTLCNIETPLKYYKGDLLNKWLDTLIVESINKRLK